MRKIKTIVCGLLVLSFGLFSGTSSYAQRITFQQIVSNPDDAALNLRFARQEIAGGRLQQAASALERLLLNRPNWDAVRFLYGVVLFRMDDLHGAKRELLLLEGRGLSSKQEKERLRYIERIDTELSPVRITGLLSIGGRVDSNPGLVSERIATAVVDPFFGPGTDLAVPVIGMDDGSDFGFTGSGRLLIEGDIEGAPGSEWFIQLDGNLKDFEDIDRADHTSGTVKAGVDLKKDRFIITPYFKSSRTRLQDEDFNQRWGGGLKINYRASPRFTLFAGGEILEEDFETTTFSINNDQRDGDSIFGYVGASFKLTEKQLISLSVFSLDKSSDVNSGFSYSQTGVIANSLTLLGYGAFLSLSAKYSEVDFDQPDGLPTGPFQNITREDERFYARAALGVPLGTIAEKLAGLDEVPEFIEDITMQAGVSWSEQNSTSILIDFDNVSGELLFTKKFEF